MTLHKGLLVRREVVPHPGSGEPITVGLSNRLPSGAHSVEVRYGARLVRTDLPDAPRPPRAVDVLEWLAMICNYDLRDREHYFAYRGLPDTAETREEYRNHRSLLVRMRTLFGEEDFADFRFHNWSIERWASGPGELVWERIEPVIAVSGVRKMRAGGQGKV